MVKNNRHTLGGKKTKKQTVIYGINCEERAKLRMRKLLKEGKMWEEADFVCCKMDAYCAPIIELSEVKKSTRKETRIFCAWKERWDMKELTSNRDVSHEAHLVRKYGGLTWLDTDNGDKITKSHANEMRFQKQRSKNRYCFFAYSEKYDLSIAIHTQEDDVELW